MLYRVFGVFIALGMFTLSWQCHVENRAFRLYGQKAFVEPVDKYMVTTTTYKSKRTGETTSEYKNTSVDAYFTTVDKQRVKIVRVIPPEIVSTIINGGTVELTYVSNNPELVRFGDQTANTGFAAITGIVILLISLIPRRNE